MWFSTYGLNGQIMILLHVGQRVARYIWSVHESEKNAWSFVTFVYL